ncbi:MAG: DUF3299 domain-containing protein [Bryobacterales bacterium]|jgi:hypothetical protein|nr:DUF3299 domain-containing protein [Bryobacterales bacterium]
MKIVGRPLLLLPLAALILHFSAMLDLPLSPRAFAQQAEAPRKVTWSMLRKFNYRTGDITEDLKSLDKKLVRVPGFIVPLEDSATEATEFLLVPYQGACIHVPPPPPNQIVHVLMAKGKKIKFTMWDPYWIEGRLRIETVESPYGEVSFSLEGVRQEDYVD